MPKSFFDIVCLGSELSGLVAATLLAKQGYRTLLVDREASASRGASGERLPGAGGFLFVGDHSSPAIKGALAQLGLAQEMRNRLRPLVPSYQIILPGHRLDVGGKAPDTDDEVRRELPELYDQLDPLLTRAEQGHDALQPLFELPLTIPPVRWRERRSWRNRLTGSGIADSLAWDDPLATFEPHHPLRLLFDAPLQFLQAGDPRCMTPLTRGRLLGHLGRGFSTIVGGKAALCDAIRERFRTYGGVLRKSELPDALQLGWWGPVLLDFDHGREEIGSRLVLWNASPELLLYRLPPSYRRRQLETLLRSIRISAYRATLTYTVKAELLPQAMAPLLFCITHPEQPLLYENLLLVATAGEGATRLLTVTFNLPAEALEEEGQKLLDRMERMVEERLRWLLPFFDHHLLDQTRLVQEQLRPLPALSPQGLASLGSLPYRSPFRQIVFSHPSILAGLGLEGEFLCAFGATQTTNSLIKRRNLLPS